MLANVVVCTSLLIDPSEPLEASVRHILLVKTPGDTLILEQVDNGADILRNLGEGITIESEIITEMRSAKEHGIKEPLEVTYPPIAAM